VASGFAGEAAWVDLAAVPDGELVPHLAAGAFGLREHASRTLTDSLIERIGDNEALLVLDNCEHLVDACAALVHTLLRACSALRILTTSRQALGVPGERAWHVPPLALPADEVAAEESGAVQLFVQRARDAQPSFMLTPSNRAAVVRICRRLDGLPLAIELAAARLSMLTPEQLAARLDDVFALLTTRSQLALPRHRTLRALIDWSYDLLTPDERVLFERIAVFASGFRLDALERVAGWGAVTAHEVLDLLASLVDRSLVVMRESAGEARYHLLDTINQYALGRLDDSVRSTHTAGERDALRRRHALYYLEMAESANRGLHGDRQRQALERFDQEYCNLRAALSWSISADAAIALRLCIAMRDFWRMRGHLTEARHYLEDALQLADVPAPLRARTLAAYAAIRRMQGDYVAIDQLREAESLARAGADRVTLADVLTQLGIAWRELQDVAAARDALNEAVSLWRALPEATGLAGALGARASVALAERDFTHARELRAEAVATCRRAGDRAGEALGLLGLGEVARLAGDAPGARAHNEHALALFLELGDSWHAGSAQHNLGWIHAESGLLPEALCAFDEGIALFTLTGNPYGATLCGFGLARLLYEAGDVDEAAVTLAAVTAQWTRIAKGVPAPADIVSCERTRELVEHALAANALAESRAAGERLGFIEAVSRARSRLHELIAPHPETVSTAVAAPPRESHHATLDIDVAAQLIAHALGPLQIFVDGRPLDGDAFGASKPRELLLLLLCHPEGCTREQVGIAFWPEASGAQVKNNFHVTLHRLRRTLAHPEWIVLSGERYRLNPALHIDFDAARFESRVRAALRANDPDGIASALDIYRGEFLEHEAVGDWHLERRDRLRALRIDALLALGRLRLHEDRSSDAAAAFRAVLARDPLHEEACRQLMICHARAGDRVQALRLYENMTALLQAELDVQPDPTTTGLYERLLRAEVV
jgi:predicted ATPase/DNA-binding SARP family transcriptional activator